jgi:hypothetical protein
LKHDGTPPPSSTSSLERKSSGLPALRQHRSIHGSGDNTSQIWTHPALPLQVRNQVGRFMPEAHWRQAAIDLTTENATSAAQVLALGDRDCVPWPPEVAGAHGDTTTSRVGRAKGGRSRKGSAFNRGRDVLPPWTPWTGPLRRRAPEHEAIWNPVAQECPLPSRIDCRPHSAQVCRRSVHAQDFDAAPSVPVPSRDWMLIFVGSFSALISAGMPDLSRGKS